MANINRFGRIRSIFLAHSRDEQIRFGASSGGFIKSFLCFLLDSHKVDYAIVTRTGGPESPISPETIISDSKEAILSTRTNSVYCPNNPFKVLDGISPRKRYVFVGLPCQISLARKTIGIEFVISLICNHTPGIEFTYKILGKLGIEKGQVSQIEYRGHGWPGGFTAYMKNGTRMFLSNYWSNDYIPEACKTCSETGGEADIVAGDPWRINEDDQMGNTLVICRNELSSRLVKKAGEYVIIKPINFEQLEKSQGRHFENKLKNNIGGI